MKSSGDASAVAGGQGAASGDEAEDRRKGGGGGGDGENLALGKKKKSKQEHARDDQGNRGEGRISLAIPAGKIAHRTEADESMIKKKQMEEEGDWAGPGCPPRGGDDAYTKGDNKRVPKGSATSGGEACKDVGNQAKSKKKGAREEGASAKVGKGQSQRHVGTEDAGDEDAVWGHVGRGKEGADAAGKYPFEADEADHAETPVEAYRDIAAVLGRLAEAMGKTRATVKVYDPYYCAGGVIKRLGQYGFKRVYNRCEDFYKMIDDGMVPDYDVLLTNPPYSADHFDKIVREPPPPLPCLLSCP